MNMERLTAFIADAGFDAVIAVSRINVIYTGGALPIGEVPFLTFVITTVDGRQAVVINEADAYFYRTASWIDDIRDFPYSATKHGSNLRATEMVGEVIDDFGLGNGRIGIEESAIAAVWLEELGRLCPRAEIVDATATFEEARLIKTQAEIDVIRYGAFCTDKAIETAFAMLRPGGSERELHAEILGNVLRLGAEDTNHALALAGEHSTVVHAQSSAKTLLPGEIVHCDIGGCFAGYMTDIGRNAAVGPARARSKEIYARLYDIQLQMLDKMRPGAVAGELWELGRRLITEAGLNHPWGTFGHSIGLGTHEGFELSAGSERVLEAGMVMNIEPTHIEQGDARYQIEDTMLIRDDAPPEVFSCYAHREDLYEMR